MLKIEKGIAIPELKKFGRLRIYPFDELGIGDSFFVPNKNGKPRYLSGMMYKAAHRTGFKFTRRTESEGQRVWRTA